MNAHPELLLVPLFPLVGSALVYFLLGRNKATHELAGWVATAASFLAFFTVLSLFRALLAAPGEDPAFVATAWQWFSVEKLTVSLGFRFDHLAAVMSLVVTGVGSLIHLYAIGYMAEDDSRPRFFAYLNLFLFSMLLLVLGDNPLMMFVGWEGVGLCSYLLIGFWFKEMPNAIAGQKAFVVNRIGDAGFLLGIFTLIGLTGTVSFTELHTAAPSIAAHWKELIALLLFVGAIGKSAQIPLFVWLPDAMAGPTPVSALIHAATMVTAGIYMIARMGFIYEAAPFALSIIAIVGTLTAFVAATIALVQNDIKKVLAYSTVSQLGYMFMAMGAGAFSNGIYHVVTHAFFKACLFMGAGSVIMGCHHEQDMRHFGGLRKYMPFTFLTYLVATLAIAGVPPLSGFFSKDQILWTVYSSSGVLGATLIGGIPLSKICWAIGLVTALMTAFYMTRSLMMTFFGSYRGHAHPHESPWVVTVPLVLLAIPSAAFGYLYGDELIHFLHGWTRADLVSGEFHHNEIYHALEKISIGVASLGVVLAVLFYTVLSGAPKRISKLMPYTYRFLEHKWWVDEFYAAVIIKPLRMISNAMFKIIDRLLIDDGMVNGSAMFVEANGEVARKMQTGQIRSYAAGMFVGIFALIFFYFVMRMV